MAEDFTQIGDLLPTARLARMMDLERDETLWPDSDLADVLRHELSAPVIPDLRREGSIDEATLSQVQSSIVDSTPLTFGQVLLDPAPPLALLTVIKNFGKSAMQKDGPLPPKIAVILYYAAILAALLRHDQRITAMDDASIRKGAQWVTEQPWVEGAIRALFVEGLARLGQ